MTIDLKAIRAAAEAAPQDRLHVRHDFGAYYSLRHYPGDYYQGRIRGKERAEYIATANPATILELLDRLEAAEKDAARMNWLEQNLFNRENIDWLTKKPCTKFNMWVLFSPVGVQGSARGIIDAAMGEQA